MVSLAYLAWPVALYDWIAPRKEASSWYRFSMRQALWFGNVFAAGALLALLWPMLVTFFVTNLLATIWLYGFAMLLDVALFVIWLVLALRYSRRAADGELFDVPWVPKPRGSRSGKL
ncbi:MAG TPA: hypothetical protein VMH02_00380 [Verrucomicrobiae bacterium]|nr:hypothetical protein [Verrucomicrobiae bacterium]